MSMSCNNVTYQARVDIWDTKRGSEEDGEGATTGHSAIELRKTCEGKTRERIYFSLRPQFAAFVNPFSIFLPSPGRNNLSFKVDCDKEGADPDYTGIIVLRKDQYEKMNERAKSLQQQIHDHHLLYSLFPSLSLLSFIKHGAARSECPFTGIALKGHRHIVHAPRSSHCALTVKEILDAGGITTPPLHPLFPWKITPRELGDGLQKSYRNERCYTVKNG